MIPERGGERGRQGKPFVPSEASAAELIQALIGFPPERRRVSVLVS